jgi:hypothetical protein
MWHEGEQVLLRGMYEGRPVYVQSTRVVRDGPAETILAIWPGAECAAPRGYIHDGHAGWDRWGETLSDSLKMERYDWHTNRFLILLEPEKFFSTIYIWNAASGEFLCHYINFQLPFRRTRFGFDTLDLDLDIVIEPSYQWHWKDAAEYQHAIRMGALRPEWVAAVERARREVAARLSERSYPLDGSWLAWKPDASWAPPQLPPDWDAPA